MVDRQFSLADKFGCSAGKMTSDNVAQILYLADSTCTEGVFPVLLRVIALLDQLF